MDVIIINKIENKIREYKKSKGVTIKFIQEQLKVPKQSLYNLFKADDISYKTLIKLSNILNCSINELVEYKIID